MTSRLLVGTALAAGVVFGAASPAAAHGGPGGYDPPASNWSSVVDAITPAVEGLTIRTIEASARIELVNRTGQDVVVLGYGGEPYLRIGSKGVFENLNSPATYLNRDRQGRTEVPRSASTTAAPQWRRIDDGPRAAWHDHRTHWMGGQLPGAVRAAPAKSHVVIADWKVPLQVGGSSVNASGDLVWVPAPSATPWRAVIVGGAVLLIVAGWSRHWRIVLVGVAALVIAASAIDVAGVWWATSDRTLSKLGELVAPLLIGSALVGGLTQLWRAPREALGLITAGAVAAGLLLGLTSLDWLSRSQVPTSINANLARGTVAVASAVALGVTGMFTIQWRRLPSPITANAPAPGPVDLSTLDLRRERAVLLTGLILVLVLYAVAA